MSDFIPRVEIRQRGPNAVILIDGTEMPGVYSYEIKQEAGNPTAQIKLGLRTDKLTFSSDSVPELPEAYKPFYKAIKDCVSD